MATKTKDALPGNATRSNTLTWEEHQHRIKACYTVTDPRAMGTLCAEAFLQLKDDDVKTLRKNLPFGAGNFQKYSAIGRALWLYEPKYKDKFLPTEFSILYQLSLFRVDEIEKAMADGIITPDVKRSAIIAWRKDARGEEAPVKQTLADRVAKALAKAKPEEKAEVAALFATPVVSSPSIAADQDAPAPAR